LSVDVRQGFGLGFDLGKHRSAGFVVATWRIWEDLLALALRFGLPQYTVVAQRGYCLGTRITRGVETDAKAFPDYVIANPEGKTLLVVDAKYKGRAGA